MEVEYIKVRQYEESKMDVSEVGDYYLLSFSDKEHIKVSEQAKKIIEKFDGITSIDDILVSLRNDSIFMTMEDLNIFIKKYLLNNSLIENSEKDSIKLSSRLWFHLPLIEGKKMTKSLKLLKFLYKKHITVFFILSTLLLQVLLLKLGYFSDISNINLYEFNSIGILSITFSSFFIHELGHVIAALNYNVVVGDMGVGLYLFRPVFYTDLSNAWKLNRKKRIVTDLGGIYFQVIMIFFLSIIMIKHNTFTLKISILLIFLSIIGNLNPVLRFDGYWVVTDLLGIVNVDKRAIALIKDLVKNVFKKRKLTFTIDANLKNGIKEIFLLYTFAYIIFTIGAIIVGIFLVFNLLTNVDMIITSFNSIYESIKHKNIVMFFIRVNNSLIILLPLIYLILLIFSIIKNSFKIKKRTARDK